MSKRLNIYIVLLIFVSIICILKSLNIKSSKIIHRLNNKSINRNILFTSNNNIASDTKQSIHSNNTTTSRDNVDLFAVSPRTFVTNAKNTIVSSTNSIVGSKGSLMEIQAEKLRLEAEKEQLSIDEQRIAEEKKRLIDIDELIIKLLNGLSFDQAIINYRPLIRKELYFRLAELANAAEAQVDKQKLIEMSELLLETTKSYDINLYTELLSNIQKEIKVEINRLKTSQKSRDIESIQSYDEILQKWMKQIDLSISNTNNTVITSENATSLIRLPATIPFNLLPVILRSTPISYNDYLTVKSEIFTNDIINITSIDYSNVLITIRGLTNQTNILPILNSKLSSVSNVKDKIRLFALPEYRLPDEKYGNIDYEISGVKYEVVYIVLSSDAVPKAQGTIEYVLIGLVLLVSMFTTLIYSVDINSLNKDFVTNLLSTNNNVVAVSNVFVIFTGILLTQLMHEIAHSTVSKYYNIKLQLPYLLPSLQIGIFGAITRFLSYPKDRKQLFDVSLAGPFIGFITSLVITLLGFDITSHATPEDVANFPYLPTGFFQFSYLFNELATNYLPNYLSPTSIASSTANGVISAVPVHPYVTIGLVGLLINSFNFLPIGRLDGGRVVTALAGRQTANAITLFTLIVEALSLISNISPETFFWLILVVFLQRGADIPPEDDITPVFGKKNDGLQISRFVTLLVCTFMTVITLCPVPFDALVTGLLPQATNIM